MAKIVLSVQSNITSAQNGIAQLKRQVLELSNALEKISINDDLTKKVSTLVKSYSNLKTTTATSVKKTKEAQQIAKQFVPSVETLRKSIYNLSTSLKTLETQYATGDFKNAAQRVTALKNKIDTLSAAQRKNGKLSKEQSAELARTSKLYKQLASDISKFKDIGTKITVDPLVSNASNTITKIRNEYARLTQQIQQLQKYYKKGTFDSQTEELKRLEPQVKALANAQDNNVTLGKKEAEQALAVDKALKSVSTSTQEAAASNKNYHGTLRDLITGFAKFQLSAMLVMKPLQLIQNALSSINETLVDTENAVVEIKRVLNESGVTNGEIADDLYDIAQSLGTTFDTVSELATEFAKQGLSWSETLEATEAAVLALNVAELDTSEATEGLVAIMAQFGYTTSDLTYIIDVLNKTADNAAVTTEELLTALQKTGSYAKSANLSLEDTVAIITALSESTAASGQNIGNAVKSLLAYSSQASSLKTFASLSDDTARVVGEYERNAATILEVWQSVAAEMGDLSAEQAELLMQWSDDSGLETELGSELSDIYDTMTGVYDTAGTYRKNYFIALLNNMDGVLEAQENIAEAEGYTAKEQETYMETYEAKLNTLQSHWEEIANDEQGILGLKKRLVEIGDVLLTVVESVGGLKTVLLATATAFSSMFSSKVGQIATTIASKFAELGKSVKDKTLGTWFKNQLSNLNKFKKATEAAQKAQEAQTVATEAQTTADELAAIAKQKNNSKTATATEKAAAAKAAQEAQTVATEAQTAATEAQTAATTALGAAISSVIGIITIAVAAVNLIINAFENAKQEYENWIEETGEGAAEATEALETLSDKIHATVNAYDEYGEKISTLRGILDDETSSTENIAEAQKQLIDIQADLASKYNSDYADSIDLVNGKLETQLSLLKSLDDREQTESEVKKQVEDYLKEYADEIYEAKKYENNTLQWADFFIGEESTATFYNSLMTSLGANTTEKFFGNQWTFEGTTLKERLAILEEAYDTAVLEAGGDYTSETAAKLRSIINDLKGDTYDEVQKLLYGDDDGEGIAKLPIEVLEAFASGEITYDEFIKKLEEAEGVQEDLNKTLDDTEKKLEYISDGWDDITEALEKHKEVAEQTEELAEKQLAIEEARQALEKAKSEKVMRFNYETMNYEVVSDEKEVASAEEELQNAITALNEYVEEQAWDEMLSEMEDGNATNEAILGILAKWINEGSESNPEWLTNYLNWIKETTGVDLTAVEEYASTLGSATPKYDSGGIASGLGLMAKATSQPETVNNPELTAKILSPTSNAQFDSYVKNIMFENAQKYAAVPQMISTIGNTTNTTNNYGSTINGVQLNAEQSNLLSQVLNVVGLVQKS